MFVLLYTMSLILFFFWTFTLSCACNIEVFFTCSFQNRKVSILGKGGSPTIFFFFLLVMFRLVYDTFRLRDAVDKVLR